MSNITSCDCLDPGSFQSLLPDINPNYPLIEAWFHGDYDYTRVLDTIVAHRSAGMYISLVIATMGALGAYQLQCRKIWCEDAYANTVHERRAIRRRMSWLILKLVIAMYASSMVHMAANWWYEVTSLSHGMEDI